MLHRIPLHRTTTRDPFGLARDLSREVDRVFESVAPAFGSRVMRQRPTLPVNIWQDEHAYFVEAEVPGVAEEDLSIDVTADALTIAGSRTGVEADQGAKVLRAERSAGEFRRTVTFPAPIDREAVSASLEHGVLLVTLPKAPEVRPTRVAVNVRRDS